MRCDRKSVTGSWVVVLCFPMLLVALTGCPLATLQRSSLDADGDGVTGGNDVCPGTPANAAVDATGCAASQRDSDGDGVTDDVDACADTPATVNTDDTGCPVSEPGTPDTDEDGVPDDIDQCPDTSSSASVDPNGCSDVQLDADGDGIRNDIDECANTPTTVTVDEVGCPVSEPGTPDADEDGIPDDIDQCPDSPTGEQVDANGCTQMQFDADGDGVPNDIDRCANTPTTVPVDDVGCPVSEPGTLDADEDGVPDDIDQCAETPTGTTVDPNGCTDSDGDGIADDDDECPQTPTDASVDAVGCADTQRDTDGDGVNDALDDCPDTPSDTMVALNGCTDSDGDGVADDDDDCPGTPPGTAVDSVGCEVTTPPPGGTTESQSVTGDVLFAGVLDPSNYVLDANGVLTEARVTLSNGLSTDPGTTVFTETAPLGVSTKLATAVIDDGSNGPLPVTFSVWFREFAVDYDSDGSVLGCPAGTVCWKFDITISTEADVSGIQSVSFTQYKGVQTGTPSGDGKTITWTSISGTRTIKTSLGASVEQTVGALEDVFAGVPLGSWSVN